MFYHALQDIFPTLDDAPIDALIHPVTKKGFRTILSGHHVRVYLLTFQDDEIHFLPQPKTDALDNHFCEIGKASGMLNAFANGTGIVFSQLVTKLSKNITGKKNTDIRAFFLFQTNTYLVKANFTFGQRTVAPGTVHVIQTTAMPLLFYYLPPRSHAAVGRRDKSFVSSSQDHYVKFILVPHMLFWVPPDTTYLLMAEQKTLFSLNVLPEATYLERIPEGWAVSDPFGCRVYRTSYLNEDIPLEPSLWPPASGEDIPLEPIPPPTEYILTYLVPRDQCVIVQPPQDFIQRYHKLQDHIREPPPAVRGETETCLLPFDLTTQEATQQYAHVFADLLRIPCSMPTDPL